jgi:hypothetical protein
MAATEAIRFGKPAQPDGILFRATESLITPSLLPLWRFTLLATDCPALPSPGRWGAPAMRLNFFQQMLELNRSFEQVAVSLQCLQIVPFFKRELIRHALSDVQMARVYANREFFDNFEKIIEDDAKWAYRFQRNAKTAAKKLQIPRTAGAHQ